MLNPSPVILSEAKDLILFRVNSMKHLRAGSAKNLPCCHPLPRKFQNDPLPRGGISTRSGRNVQKENRKLVEGFFRLGHFCPIFSASNGYGNLVPDQIQWFFQKIAVSYHLAFVLLSILMSQKTLTRSLGRNRGMSVARRRVRSKEKINV